MELCRERRQSWGFCMAPAWGSGGLLLGLASVSPSCKLPVGPLPNKLWEQRCAVATSSPWHRFAVGQGAPLSHPWGRRGCWSCTALCRAHIERCSSGTGGWPVGPTPCSVWGPWPRGPAARLRPAGGTPSSQQQRHRCSEANLPEERRSPVGKHLVAISSTCYLESGSRNRVGRNKAEIHSVSN